jgi:hypothetical protein
MIAVLPDTGPQGRSTRAGGGIAAQSFCSARQFRN